MNNYGTVDNPARICTVSLLALMSPGSRGGLYEQGAVHICISRHPIDGEIIIHFHRLLQSNDAGDELLFRCGLDELRTV